jgi:hypothetical protein
MKHLEDTIATFLWNIYNIQIKYLEIATWKHLFQRKTETATTFWTYSCNLGVKHVQHLDKKHLQYKAVKHFE